MKFTYGDVKTDLNKSGIYSIINLRNNKKYIGSAINMKRRPIQIINIITGEKIIRNTLKDVSIFLNVSMMIIHNRLNEKSKYNQKIIKDTWMISRINEETNDGL